jgi:hypothetical protein
MRDYGVLADIGEFYSAGRGVNRLSVTARLLFPVLASLANRRIEAVRSSAAAAGTLHSRL